MTALDWINSASDQVEGNHLDGGVTSSQLLRRLRDTMAEANAGQERLDKVVDLIADSLGVDVCSIYLQRDDGSFELSATHGLSEEAVHQTIMKKDEGLVGRVARDARPLNTADAPNTRGFSFRPETGEEIYRGFLGVPIQRLGQVMGVLVVQTSESRNFGNNEISALEIVAIVLAEMTELGAFADEQGGVLSRPRQHARLFRGVIGQEGVCQGTVVMHNPRVNISRPVADDPDEEKERLADAFSALDQELSELSKPNSVLDQETSEIISVFETVSRDKGLRRRLIEDIENGLSSEAAVEMEQTRIRSRMKQISDPYIRERLADIDELSNRLLRILSGVSRLSGEDLPEDAIIVARNIGPADLLEYGRKIKGVVLAEGAVGSHATIIARSWAIPMILQAKNITIEAEDGNRILVDGEQGLVHLRPDENVVKAFQDKIAMNEKAQVAYSALRDLPAITQDGVEISLMMNAGLLADLPSLAPSGADGVGLFRTELQFLANSKLPKRDHLVQNYQRILSAAGDKPVIFRTLDIGSDKVLPYMQAIDEPNPAMGWRAIRLGLDRANLLKMQIQGLLRAAGDRDLNIMFPFVTECSEFYKAKQIALDTLARYEKMGYAPPSSLRLGAMLETPSLAFAPDHFFNEVDFLSIGGNDLKQFFFAADRENERVRRRYDMLSASYLAFLRMIAERAKIQKTKISFCGEDAGKPLEALALIAMGFRTLSMRPASIGMIKNLIRQVNLGEMREAMLQSMDLGHITPREALLIYMEKNNIMNMPSVVERPSETTQPSA